MATYKLISSYTVGSGGIASIEFNTIPSTYTDLIVKYSIRSNRSGVVADGLWIQYNNSTTTFTSYQVYGSGTVVGSINNGQPRNVGITTGTTATANTFAIGQIYIPNYTSSNHKSYLTEATTETDAAESYYIVGAGVWATTDAINKIVLSGEFATLFLEHSTAYLYGISNA